MIIDLTPRLPYRASPELMEIWRARIREPLEAPETVSIREAAREREQGGRDKSED